MWSGIFLMDISWIFMSLPEGWGCPRPFAPAASSSLRPLEVSVFWLILWQDLMR